MRQRFGYFISGGILVVTACTDWRTPERNPLQVDWSMSAEGLAEQVVEIRLRHPAGRPPLPQDMALFEGDVTESALHDGDFSLLSRALQEKRVPLRIDLAPDASLRVIPQRVLSPGFRYTLAARGSGRVALLEVTAESEQVLLRRVWPRGAALGPLALFCGGAEPLPVLEFALDSPTGSDNFVARARLSPHAEPVVTADGTGSQACAWLELVDEASGGVPAANRPSAASVNWAAPLRFEGYLLEPYNLGWLTGNPVERPPCTASEVELGPACAQVLDDRVVVLAPDVQSAWQITSGEGSLTGELRLATEGESLSFRGLRPESVQTLRGQARLATGERWEFERDVTTSRAEPHLQISEVLANPLGSEPQSEWIELLNDGSAPQNLEGGSLDDGNGTTALPRAVVQPGEYVLVVRDDFIGGDPDVPVMPETQLVHVSSLGKSGLSNAGEVWTLRDSNQRTLSVFPAFASKSAGQSLARRSAQSSDSSSSFGPHAAPGASPGAANHVLEP